MRRLLGHWGVAYTLALCGGVVFAPLDGVTQSAAASEGPTIGQPVELTPDAENIKDWEMTADGSWMVWEDETATGDVLWARSTDGLGAPVRLTPPAAHAVEVDAWELTPNGEHVVFLADSGADGAFAWRSVEIEAGVASVEQLSAEADRTDFNSWEVSPDSSHLVFRSRSAPNSWSLVSAPVAGGPAVVLLPALAAGRSAHEFDIAADSSRVVFTADYATDDVRDLYTTPIAGPADAMVAFTAMSGALDAWNPAVSSDSQWVVYELHSGPDNPVAILSVRISDGEIRPIKNHGACCAEITAVTPSADGPDRVVYRRTGAAAVSGDAEMWSAPVDDSQAPIRLNVDNAHPQEVRNEYVAGDALVYQSDEREPGVLEVFEAPLDAPSESRRISLPLGAGESVAPLVFTPLGGPASTVGYRIETPSGSYVPELASTEAGVLAERVALPPVPYWGRARLSPSSDALIWESVDPVASEASMWLTQLEGPAAGESTELTAGLVGVASNARTEIIETSHGYAALFDLEMPAGSRVWRVDVRQPSAPGDPGDPGDPGAPGDPGGDVLVPVTPARLWDTRNELTVDGLFRNTGRVGAHEVSSVQVTGRAGVPAGAIGAVVNLTVVGPDGPGHATVFPCGDVVPNASVANYVAGDVLAANVYVALDAEGRVCVSSFAATDLVLDVNGYMPAESPIELFTPARFYDSRQQENAVTIDGVGQGGGRIAAGHTVEVPIVGRGLVPADAHTAFVSVTAVAPDDDGYLTVFPCGDRPPTSTVNYAAGQTVPNGAVMRLSDDGTICVFTLAETDLIVDVGGALAVETDRLVTTVPVRLWDSRPGGESVDGGNSGSPGRLGAEETVELEVAGRGPVPADATAALFNITIVNPAGITYATLFPCGDRPIASNVNLATAGANRANNALTLLSPDGTVCVFGKDASDYVLDLTGWTTE